MPNALKRPRIKVVQSHGEETTFQLENRTLTIGRRSDNDVQVSDPHISRYHAEVILQDGNWRLRDLGSKEGTFVNGRRVTDHRLRDGDLMTLGRNHAYRLLYLEGSQEDSVNLRLGDLRDTTKEDYQALMLLLEVTKALSSSLVLGDVLSMVMDAVLRVTGAERGFLMLRSDKGDLNFSVARNFNGEPLATEAHAISRSVVERVVETGEPEILVNVDDNERFRNQQSILALELKTIMCVPLIVSYFGHEAEEPRLLGIIYVDNKTQSQDFTKKGLRLLESLASHAAIAIENARLHEEELEKKRMEEELNVARIIQERLLPVNPPSTPYLSVAAVSRPSRSVGGDYYNYYPMEEGLFGFVVGDVSGKGIPAALLMCLVDGIFSAQAEFAGPVNKTVARVNNYLHKKSAAEKFVTLFYGTLTSDGLLTYTNAGHDPPFLFSRDGTHRRLERGGLLLGAFPGLEYESETIQLAAGDTLLLFTDGVSESRNSAGEEFGLGRIIEVVGQNFHRSAPEIQDALEQAIDDFSRGASQHDDVTMLILQYGPGLA